MASGRVIEHHGADISVHELRRLRGTLYFSMWWELLIHQGKNITALRNLSISALFGVSISKVYYIFRGG